MDVRSKNLCISPTGISLPKNSYMNKLNSISVTLYLSTGRVTDGQTQDSFHTPWNQSSKYSRCKTTQINNQR